jgi:hypothetical protein
MSRNGDDTPNPREMHELGDETQKRPVADIKKFVGSLDLMQMRFLMTVLMSGPTAIAECYNWSHERWNSFTQAERDKAAAEAQERFFTVEAWERYNLAHRLGVDDPTQLDEGLTVNLDKKD